MALKSWELYFRLLILLVHECKGDDHKETLEVLLEGQEEETGNILLVAFRKRLHEKAREGMKREVTLRRPHE
jgi:hypothetical protein